MKLSTEMAALLRAAADDGPLHYLRGGYVVGNRHREARHVGHDLVTPEGVPVDRTWKVGTYDALLARGLVEADGPGTHRRRPTAGRITAAGRAALESAEVDRT